YVIKPLERRELRGSIEVALQRNKTESKLRKKEESLTTILKSIGGAVIATDIRGSVTFMNPLAEVLTGWKQEDALGKDSREVFNIVNEKTRASIENPATKAIREDAIVEFEHGTLLIAKDGTETPILDSAAPLRDHKGNITGAVLVFRDITKHKKAEEVLIRSEKFEALEEMAAGVAHDFNNLLAIILLNAHLLEKGLKPYKVEEFKKSLERIMQASYEGGETVRKLQYLTEGEVSRGNFTRVDLNEVARQAIASTSSRWKDEAEAKGATIRIKEELGKLPLALGSAPQLTSVLTHLIFNAVEAMPEGGDITVRTEAKENEALLHLTDSGKGIPREIKHRIFDPFFTTKGPKASGLGLSVCHAIIDHHQGRIEVESTEGKGATFTISIPAQPEAPSKKEKLNDS
ncbi:PAS domain S-box protein, partial [Candidatus Aerophobetes bacterium]